MKKIEKNRAFGPFAINETDDDTPITEYEEIRQVGVNVMYHVVTKFGPGNSGNAIAALCVALGTVYDTLLDIRSFYMTPEHFADCVRKMVFDVASRMDDTP